MDHQDMHPLRIPVIIDTDPGVDDVLALLLALASPELDILAITVTFGNTGVDACYANVLKLFDVVARHVENHPEDADRFVNFRSSAPIILAKGSNKPLGGELHTAKYFHGRDGLADISSRHPELAIRNPPTEDQQMFHNLILSSEDAATVTLRLVATRAEREITYIALGPLTTFATVFRRDSKLMCERLGRVVCMGGALEAAGNTTPVAEFNFYADPYAVREVLGLDTSSNAPHFPLDRFVLCPLDLTTKHGLSMGTYAELIDPLFKNSTKPSEEGSKPGIHHFTSSVLERTKDVLEELGIQELQLHDPLAVWCAIENPPVKGDGMPTMQKGWECTPRMIDIERTGELTRGMVVVDRRTTGGGRNRATEGPSSEVVVRPIGVVSETPGSDALVALMAERVWGVASEKLSGSGSG